MSLARSVSREQSVLRVLQKLPKKVNLILVGGYAVNAYVPPRFSIDCDLVVLGDSDAIEHLLQKGGFERVEFGDESYSIYARYESKADKISFDLLINSVFDKPTGISFEAELFKKYSRERTATGRLSTIRISIRIADPELLFAMKFVSGRKQDIRDLFMLSGAGLKWEIVSSLISEKCNAQLIKKRIDECRKTLGSKNYRDSLQGPYGKIPERIYNTCAKSIGRFLDRMWKPF
jgi:hypothetical protein